jgi:hypothetical protein
MPPKRGRSDDTATAAGSKRQQNAARQAVRRAAMTPSQLEANRQRNRDYQARRRGQLSAEQQQEVRRRDRERKKKKREEDEVARLRELERAPQEAPSNQVADAVAEAARDEVAAQDPGSLASVLDDVPEFML